jgi:hypothetical protein
MEDLLWPQSARAEASSNANERSNAAATTSLPAAVSFMFLHADKKMNDRFGNRIVSASISHLFSSHYFFL